MAASRIRTVLLLLGVLIVSATASAGETVELKYKQKFMVVTAKGTIVSQDMKGVVFRKDGAPEGETVDIAWPDIRAVDGKPADEVFAKLKERLAALACPDCKGKGNFGKCLRCGGVGKQYSKTMACPACKGTGSAACGYCKKGLVPCPGKCLKVSTPGWKKKPKSGALYRSYTFKDVDGNKVTVDVSIVHVGDVIDLSGGGFSRYTCKKCSGQATVKCKLCEGTGKRDCAVCRGALEVPDPRSGEKCGGCVSGNVPCKKCGGTGIIGGGGSGGVKQPASEPAAGDAPADDTRKVEVDPNAIRLKDGRVIKGKVMMRTEKTVIVKTDSGEVISIDRDQVAPAP